MNFSLKSLYLKSEVVLVISLYISDFTEYTHCHDDVLFVCFSSSSFFS